MHFQALKKLENKRDIGMNKAKKNLKITSYIIAALDIVYILVMAIVITLVFLGKIVPQIGFVVVSVLIIVINVVFAICLLLYLKKRKN